MIVIVLFLLIIAVDILTIKDIMNSPISGNVKLIFILIVLLIPIIGSSVYYFTKRK